MYWCDYIGMNMLGEQQKFLFYEHIVSFRLLEPTAARRSEVSEHKFTIFTYGQSKREDLQSSCSAWTGQMAYYCMKLFV